MFFNRKIVDGFKTPTPTFDNKNNVWFCTLYKKSQIKSKTIAPKGGRREAPPPVGRRRRRHLCFQLFYNINIHGYSLYIPHIFHTHIYIYIYFLNVFHMFFLVCFLIYEVKSRSGHDRSQSFVHSTQN